MPTPTPTHRPDLLLWRPSESESVPGTLDSQNLKAETTPKIHRAQCPDLKSWYVAQHLCVGVCVWSLEAVSHLDFLQPRVVVAIVHEEAVFPSTPAFLEFLLHQPFTSVVSPGG